MGGHWIVAHGVDRKPAPNRTNRGQVLQGSIRWSEKPIQFSFRRNEVYTEDSSTNTVLAMDFPIKPLITLLAIVNPIGVIPFFIHFTRNLSRDQRTKTVRTAAFTAFLVIAISALFGLKILEFFGISLASFQVGGGLLLLMSSIQMLNAQPAESRAHDVDEGSSRADSGASIAVVPLTIPLLTGPAAISTVVIYAEKTNHLWELSVLICYGLIIGIATWLALSAAGRIGRFMGQTGINVMTRLMGLILAAIAVEVMSDGLVKLFPVLSH